MEHEPNCNYYAPGMICNCALGREKQITPPPEAAPTDAESVRCSALVSLAARWLEKADLRDMQAAYADDDNETKAALLRREATIYRKCANALKRAGSEANDQS